MRKLSRDNGSQPTHRLEEFQPCPTIDLPNLEFRAVWPCLVWPGLG